MKLKLLDFWNNFDFDALIDFIIAGRWGVIITNWFFLGIAVILIALIAYKKTRDVGTMWTQRAIIGATYGVCGVALKNSQINEIGPFFLALALVLGIIGYTMVTRFLR